MPHRRLKRHAGVLLVTAVLLASLPVTTGATQTGAGTPPPPSTTVPSGSTSPRDACTGEARDRVVTWYVMLFTLGEQFTTDTDDLNLATSDDRNVTAEDMATLRQNAANARTFLDMALAVTPPEMARSAHEALVAFVMVHVAMWDLHVTYAGFVQQGLDPTVLDPLVDAALETERARDEIWLGQLRELENACGLSEDLLTPAAG